MDGRECVLADIPGLIEGAHEGAGIGVRFLGHVERCRVLLHLVDGTSESVVQDYKTVCDELIAYGGGLAEKTTYVVLNKIDAMTDEEIQQRSAALQEASGSDIMQMSGATGQGVDEVLRAVFSMIEQDRAREEAPETEETDWSPVA